jgi:hypothetical protein
MSGISPYADVKPESDPFVLYRLQGDGWRLAGEGDDVEGELDDDEVEGDGISLAGAGFGKGTRRKIVKAVGKYAPIIGRAGIGLVSEFGSQKQKAVASNALAASRIINGATIGSGKGVALRALMN